MLKLILNLFYKKLISFDISEIFESKNFKESQYNIFIRKKFIEKLKKKFLFDDIILTLNCEINELEDISKTNKVKYYFKKDSKKQNTFTLYGFNSYNGILEKTLISTFSLSTLHGCCGVLVFYNAYVNPKFRGNGVGSELNKIALRIGKSLNYGSIICTDVINNEYQEKILKKNNWKNLFNFKNPNTNNSVNINCFNLNDEISRSRG